MNQATSAQILKTKPRILFLYCELASYFIACLRKLVDEYDVEVHVIRLPVNEVAPLKIEDQPNIFYYERQDLDNESLLALCKSLNPDFLYVNGWIDKAYIKTAKHFYGNIPTVLTFDNPWKGNLKQWLGSLLAPIYFSKIFSHCWVPGKSQYEYAKHLGFSTDKIFTGMYSADVDFFKSKYRKYRESKVNKFPKRILYVGRYTDLKGVVEMWDAFINIQNETPNDWELWCIGKGDLDHLFPQHEKVKNFGFVQPAEMEYYIEHCGVFILPSKFEHWGVVVHEFAASGFPIISSDQTAAADAFLKDGYNGFCHRADDRNSIEQAFKKLFVTDDATLIEMGDRSVELADQINPDKWAKQIIGLLKKTEQCVE